MGQWASHKNFVGKTPGGLSDKCLLISDPVFHMPGPDHRRLGIGGLPGYGLLFFFFHVCAPFGDTPFSGCAVFTGLFGFRKQCIFLDPVIEQPH